MTFPWKEGEECSSICGKKSCHFLTKTDEKNEEIMDNILLARLS
jgi:hypothetical protein